MENFYEMPQISDLLDEVVEACWLSKPNLSRGFNKFLYTRIASLRQLLLTLGKVCIHLHIFGLINAPATSQRYIAVAPKEQLGFCSRYTYDATVYSTTFEQHLEH